MASVVRRSILHFSSPTVLGRFSIRVKEMGHGARWACSVCALGLTALNSGMASAQSRPTGVQGPSGTLMIQLQVGDVGGLGPDEIVGVDEGPIGPIFGVLRETNCALLGGGTVDFGKVGAGKPLSEIRPNIRSVGMITFRCTNAADSDIGTQIDFKVQKTQDLIFTASDGSGVSGRINYILQANGFRESRLNIPVTLGSRNVSKDPNGALPPFVTVFTTIQGPSFELPTTGNVVNAIGKYEGKARITATF